MSTGWLPLCHSPAKPPVISMGPRRPPWEGWGPGQGLCHRSRHALRFLHTNPAQTSRVHPSIPPSLLGSFLFLQTLLGAGALAGPHRAPGEDADSPQGHGGTASSAVGACWGCTEPLGVSWGYLSHLERAVVPQLLTPLLAWHGTAQVRLQGARELPAPWHAACAKPPDP